MSCVSGGHSTYWLGIERYTVIIDVWGVCVCVCLLYTVERYTAYIEWGVSTYWLGIERYTVIIDVWGVCVCVCLLYTVERYTAYIEWGVSTYWLGIERYTANRVEVGGGWLYILAGDRKVYRIGGGWDVCVCLLYTVERYTAYIEWGVSTYWLGIERYTANRVEVGGGGDSTYWLEIERYTE